MFDFRKKELLKRAVGRRVTPEDISWVAKKTGRDSILRAVSAAAYRSVELGASLRGMSAEDRLQSILVGMAANIHTVQTEIDEVNRMFAEGFSQGTAILGAYNLDSTDMVDTLCQESASLSEDVFLSAFMVLNEIFRSLIAEVLEASEDPVRQLERVIDEALESA